MFLAAILLILAGTIFFAAGTIGLLRFPDIYTRMHATGKCDTLGTLLILIGLAIYHGFSLMSLKIMFIGIFVFLVNPTSTHAIARAAWNAGIKPWKKEER